ncbi:MAG: HIRAN domain-containing protein [Pseudomonadota bacterium]|nr:HIRAN domain-containing protein [Pseudomonadota bacterium]
MIIESLVQPICRLFMPPPFAPTVQRRPLQDSPLAGFQYYRGRAVWSFLREGEALRLVREPFNFFDTHAVAVYFRNEKLGYLPRARNRAVAQMLDRGRTLHAEISRLQRSDDPWDRVQVRVSLVQH